MQGATEIIRAQAATHRLLNEYCAMHKSRYYMYFQCYVKFTEISYNDFAALRMRIKV